MLMKVDERTVASDAGFTVRHDNVYRLHYREGDRVLIFGLEPTGKNSAYDFILYANSSLSRSWQPPFENEVITKDKREQILQNVEAALKLLNYKPLIS